MKQKSIQNNLKKSMKIECQRENEKELQGLLKKKKNILAFMQKLDEEFTATKANYLNY